MFPFSVKPEPTEARLPLQQTTASQNSTRPTTPHSAKREGYHSQHSHAGIFSGNRAPVPKPEPVAERLPQNENDLVFGGTFQRPPPPKHNSFQSAFDIDYSPENALKEGLKITQSIEASIKTLQFESKLRKNVWDAEIAKLKAQCSPTTLIAVCGATGAGKSSILNAILDDNIVPTSGMRACTAVVTEIAYHKKQVIHGDVSFLSQAEWAGELAVLLHDLVDEDGTIKRTTDLKSDAGIAWSKVHAVYPQVKIEKLVKMDVQQILDLDHNIAQILGTTKHIVAKDSKTFGKEIAKYIDSKDQQRGDKKKGKKKDKNKKKSTMDKVRELAGQHPLARKDAPQDDGPAFWPLIRQVNVRCPAKALSTGAVLVDLPGVADANVARSSIAKDYMKKADCIWILAPITRAVDDKTARDLLGDAFKMQLTNGNYDEHCITFIASKCDDISCSEVINALHLGGDPELEAIEDKIDDLREKISEQKRTKTDCEKEVKKINEDLKELRDQTDDWKKHLKALEDGESYVSKFAPKAKSSSPSGKKRKNNRGGKGGSSKKQRSVVTVSDDSENESDDDISVHTDSDQSEDESEESEDDSDDDDSDEDSDDEDQSTAGSADEVADDLLEEETEETLKEKLEVGKEGIKALRASLKEAKKGKQDALDRTSSLQKQLSRAQKEKNAFCAKKRSEFSRDVLKNDFRTGLKDLDDAEAEKNDPDNFDPTNNIRDYDSIDLPVFTCSSRDYVRLKGQVKGDGDASCFSNIEDTGIPAVQKWCHQLTIASRERAARAYIAHLATFARSIQTYIQGIVGVTPAERQMLRDKWESQGFVEQHSNSQQHRVKDDPWAQYLGVDQEVANILRGRHPLAEKRDANGKHIGITPRLREEFIALVDECVEDLKERLKDGVEEKCREGATQATAQIIPIHDEVVASVRWNTYRATLKRHGIWRHNLNELFSAPFTKAVAASWGATFKADLFGPFDKAITKAVTDLLQEIETTSPVGLQDRIKGQGEACSEEARQTLESIIGAVEKIMSDQQKDINRHIAPHVQSELVDGYDLAMEERGRGSVARQRAVMCNYIKTNKEYIFEGGADAILDKLDAAADAVGLALCDPLASLAEKVEVNIAVLWEGLREDPAQVHARKHVVGVVKEIQKQLGFWQTAAQLDRERNIQSQDGDEDELMDDEW